MQNTFLIIILMEKKLRYYVNFFSYNSDREKLQQRVSILQ